MVYHSIALQLTSLHCVYLQRLAIDMYMYNVHYQNYYQSLSTSYISNCIYTCKNC